MRILIAEDDTTIQKMTGRLMTHWGFDFDIASNGQEAVNHAKANEGKYDLCLMDIDMPILNGLEATKVIRCRLKYFPIMAVTGNLRGREEYLTAGMDDFLEKPYSINNLYSKINNLTTKVEKIYLANDKLKVIKETPMNREELQELIALKKKGLTKLKLVGVGTTFVVHRNIQNKISYDLVGKGKELTEFIDRSENEPGRCHLYKCNLHVTKDIFTPDELESAIRVENEIAEKFTHVVDKKTKE
ncbi:MAG: response regulator [Desulfomonilia bacterium]|nr:response regulator [Deltaproteobacteria bacterium]HPW67832.1 response regulator [Deltaproteobacteria bacterium]